MITFSGLLFRITFVVTEITFKVAMITSSVAKMTLVVAEITLKVDVITSPVVKITFKKELKKTVGNCFNGGVIYKIGALLYISFLTEIKYYVSTLKPLRVTFNCYQRCWYIFLFWVPDTHWAKM